MNILKIILCTMMLAAMTSCGGGGGDSPAPAGDMVIMPPTGDGNDTAETATPITADTAVSGSITPADDVDYYRIVLSSRAQVVIETTGSTDTAGVLEDSDGTQLTSDDNGGTGSNFRILRTLETGTWYIRVAGSATGDYSLLARITDGNDSVGSATTIALGGNVPGSISPAGDVDYYSFTLTARSQVVIETTGSAEVHLQIQPQSGSALGTAGRPHGDGALPTINSSHDTGTSRIVRTLDAGTWHLRVTGSDSDATGDYSLSTTVTELDGNDTPATATAITAGTAVSGSIAPAGDLDYYSFSLAARSQVVIETTGSTNTAGRLEDSAGTVLESDDDDGTGTNFRILRNLDAGDYYIRVAGQDSDTTGDYSLSATVTELDGNDTLATATAITAGTAVSGSISPAGDLDYYSFTLAARSSVVIQTTGSTNTAGRLEDSAGTELAADGDSGTDDNFMIARALDAGTWYIRVAGHDGDTTGDYSLSATVTADGDGTRSGATAITLGSPTAITAVSGSISPTGDLDYYSFALTARSEVTIETTGSTDTAGQLINSTGTTLEEDDNSGAGNNFSITRTLDAGTWYLRVAGGTGNYSLIATVTDDDDTRGDATAITLGGNVSGTIAPTGDTDYYSFALSARSEVTIQTTGATDTTGQLQDSTGTVLANDGDSGTGGNFRIIRTLDAGTYYIRVTGYISTSTIGNYSLSATAVVERDGNDSITSADAITLGSDVSGTISPVGDIDYYSFALSSRSEVVIQTTGSTDTTGQLLNSSGTPQKTDFDSGTGTNFRITRTINAGTWYIRVSGRHSDSTTGDYTLVTTVSDP